MFSKVLIANRGEIAVRIAQTLREMGIGSVAVYSTPDSGALHVASADEAYPLEGESAGDTYLRGDKIIEIAVSHGVEAIHPGYGFLSENAEFAQACADAGLTFIGPTPEVIRQMGDKIVAKKVLADAGVPMLPGGSANDASGLKKHASRIGYPAIIKAAAGGGGRGMRIVKKAADLKQAIEAAQREAGAAFADSRVFIEKYIEKARHIEFQIFGDSHGNVVHMFERECSIQRRHQKIIEESPSPGLDPALRKRMGESAVLAAKTLGYSNAGTVEFMLDANGDHYFLEVNTRLQVEHPVTEMTLGQDLVRLQVCVANGAKLPFGQDDLQPRGHAIECRIYAEDARNGFTPSIGMIAHHAAPLGGHGVRVDSGISRGSLVTVHYDAMLAKLVVWAADRPAAVDSMKSALERYAVLGVTTNIEFLRAVVGHSAFAAGHLHTGFLDEHCSALAHSDEEPPPEALIAAAWALAKSQVDRSLGERVTQAVTSPWQEAGPWRSC